jgi:DNA-binding transcriptional MocR family regulator
MSNAAKSQGVREVGVEMDDQGLLPEHLDWTLNTWDVEQGRKPSVLYMIPTGHNPTGTTQTRERRVAIYAIAELHDLLIVEDDLYMFLELHFDEPASSETPDCLTLEDRYLTRLQVSYLSLTLLVG